MNNLEDFSKQFAKRWSQKETRQEINRKGSTRLSLMSLMLLRYLVGYAWLNVPGMSGKRTVTVSKKAMATNCKNTSPQVIDYNLNRLMEEGLISKVEDGYEVHCEPMEAWETAKAVAARQKAKRRATQARIQRERRGTWTQEQEDAHMEWATA